MLGGVVEVVSSNPTVGHKIFSTFTGIVDLLYLSISICIINLFQLLILCSTKVLLLRNYISLMPNIYIISLVFSESGRLSWTNGIDATHKEELIIRRVLHWPIPISVLFEQTTLGLSR